MKELIESLKVIGRVHPNCFDETQQAIKVLQQMQNDMEEARVLIKAAACPNCRGDGAYYDTMGNVRQCQWCAESKDFLKRIEGGEK